MDGGFAWFIEEPPGPPRNAGSLQANRTYGAVAGFFSLCVSRTAEQFGHGRRTERRTRTSDTSPARGSSHAPARPPQATGAGPTDIPFPHGPIAAAS